MIGNYKVITLCGSTRFKDEFMAAQKRLTLAGNIVISVGVFGHSGDADVLSEETKEMLDDMHKRKIDMADEIYAINVGGYIGSSTRSEIDYAKEHRKNVHYLEEEEPPEEVQEVKNGKWMDGSVFLWKSKDESAKGFHTATCSNCRITQSVNVYRGKIKFRYCPYCGAKMDLGD
jgi:hypothetical protein